MKQTTPREEGQLNANVKHKLFLSKLSSTFFHLKKRNSWYNNIDRRQTCDTVDTTPKDRPYWPAVEDFQDREEILKWRDIQQGIYKVHEVMKSC